MIETRKITVTTTGSAGSATGTTTHDRPLSGEIFAIRVDWSTSAPGTSTIAITITSDDDHPAVTLYSKSSANTDLWVYPYVQGTDTAGAAITGVYQRILASGYVSVAVSGCDALAAAVVVTVYALAR